MLVRKTLRAKPQAPVIPYCALPHHKLKSCAGGIDKSLYHISQDDAPVMTHTFPSYRLSQLS